MTIGYSTVEYLHMLFLTEKSLRSIFDNLLSFKTKAPTLFIFSSDRILSIEFKSKHVSRFDLSWPHVTPSYLLPLLLQSRPLWVVISSVYLHFLCFPKSFTTGISIAFSYHVHFIPCQGYHNRWLATFVSKVARKCPDIPDAW